MCQQSESESERLAKAGQFLDLIRELKKPCKMKDTVIPIGVECFRTVPRKVV